MTSFVGRRRELTEAKRAMSEARLVTLTGPGGVGKTRIGGEIASRSRKAFRDGVWTVELASLENASSPVALASAVLSALQVTDQSNRAPADKLADYLRDQQLLIVLDNCEHVLPSVAALAARLLDEAPALRVLATSREPLRISGEYICVIPPLTVPPLDRVHTLQGIAHFEAVVLLLDRARAIAPDFAITVDNLDAVVQLCNRLDGIPLSIELAATRLRALSVTQVVERLDKRFQLLTSGSRVSVPRQQTLRALIDWSYDLCSAPEQLLWARLSVFRGSFDLAAAEWVCGFGELDAELIIDVLDRLVAMSILQTERESEIVRYRLLMTVREYGAEFLQRSGDYSDIKQRHRDHYLHRVHGVVDRWCGPHQADDLAMMRHAHPNLLAALEWSVNTDGQPESGAELASLLRYHWLPGGFLSDGRRWLDSLLSHLDEDPSSQRGSALWVVAWIALIQGDHAAAASYLAECMTIADRLDDRLLAAHATHFLGLHQAFSGNPGRAVELLEQALDVHVETGDASSTLIALFMLAYAQLYNSQVDDAFDSTRRALRISEAHGEQWARSYTWWITGLCYWRRGKLDAAQRAAFNALELQRMFQDGACIALTVELLSWIAASRSDTARAAELANAAAAVWSLLGTSISAFGPHIHADSTRCAALIARGTTDKQAQALRDKRAQITKDDAIGLALGSSGPRQEHKPAGKPQLTKRELEIATLVSNGMSNRAVAESLVLSPRTVDGHIERILVKLDFTSRSQIAAWVANATASKNS